METKHAKLLRRMRRDDPKLYAELNKIVCRLRDHQRHCASGADRLPQAEAWYLAALVIQGLAEFLDQEHGAVLVHALATLVISIGPDPTDDDEDDEPESESESESEREPQVITGIEHRISLKAVDLAIAALTKAGVWFTLFRREDWPNPLEPEVGAVILTRAGDVRAVVTLIEAIGIPQEIGEGEVVQLPPGGIVYTPGSGGEIPEA